MNILTKTTVIALTTILLGTSLASALDRHISIGGGGSMPINDSISEAVKDEPISIDMDTVEAMDLHRPKMEKFVDIGLFDAKGQPLKSGHFALDCSLGGADLLIANAGTIGLPAGTKLKWSVKSYGAQGYVRLKHGLEAGADVRVASVLDGAAQDGTSCAVKVSGL